MNKFKILNKTKILRTNILIFLSHSLYTSLYRPISFNEANSMRPNLKNRFITIPKKIYNSDLLDKNRYSIGWQTIQKSMIFSYLVGRTIFVVPKFSSMNSYFKPKNDNAVIFRLVSK